PDELPRQPTSAEVAEITMSLSDPYIVPPRQSGDDEKDPIQVYFAGEYVGGPLDPDLGYTPWTPDEQCLVEIDQNFASVTTATCTLRLTSPAAGTTTAYFWVDENRGEPETNVEADGSEGRYSGPQDCVEANSDTTNGVCVDDASKPGAVAEPDITDVVEITFYAAPANLDCDPQVQTGLVDTATVRPAATAVFDCLVTSPRGEPVPNVIIDGENYADGDERQWDNTGANDPDQSEAPREDSPEAATPQTADYQDDDADTATSGCTTNAEGRCTVTVPPVKAQLGTAMICYWVDGIEGATPDAPDSDEPDTTFERPNNAANEETDGGHCDHEQVDERNPDGLGNAAKRTDLVMVNWEHPLFLKGGIDLQPESQLHRAGETATLTAKAYDQFGDPMANVVVAYEFFRNSPSHPETINTPEEPDETCVTGANGTCSISFTSAKHGDDVVCAWTRQLVGEETKRDDPQVIGNNQLTSEPVCGPDLEGPTDPSADDGKPSPAFDAIDVAYLRWPIPPPPPPPPPPPEPKAVGYWLTGGDGGVFAYGDAAFLGSMGGERLNKPIVGMAATPSGNGYWLVASDGGVFAFGDAGFYGSTGGMHLNKPIVNMAPTPSGKGYWLVASDGGIFAFGDAQYFGSTGDIRLNFPIITMAPTLKGDGYWLVASDGGIFAFGKAPYYGSTGDFPLAEPIATIAPTPTGEGYYLVARNGDIFTFGDASYYGSIDPTTVVRPVVGMGASPTGEGYYLATADGGVFAFGDAEWYGSAGNVPLNGPILGLAVSIKDVARKSQ
ncbi:MAG TPA: Ig-like domain-containing protein, partial [Acidimicrobiales bacterium]